MSQYNPQEIEKKWQNFWESNKTFRTKDDLSKPKYYVLDMFPYPSGDGLHVGHPEGYTATDILCRYKRMNGFNVLHPMGWDAFGLPAERHAMRTGTHPAVTTIKNTDNFRKQIKALGFSYDWDREISTTHVDYYKFTQWIFLKLYEKGLAYQEEVPVNWCPAQGTVLANEEVKDGKYVETGDIVEQRVMKQWMLKITAYAQRLLDDLEELDWPEGIKSMQRHWIGRSQGAEIRFAVQDSKASFEVFTTRPDTLLGATYCVLSPEHPVIESIVTDEQKEKVFAYVHQAKNMKDRERLNESREKTGVFTGAYAINPANQEALPIYVADYVLIHYGTGAIMSVPAHDVRDWEFAKKYDLPIREVVSGGDVAQGAYTGDGILVNSGFLDGLEMEEAKQKMCSWLEEQKVGKTTITYKLRDWLFSRQRYWGEPFPILHLEDGTCKPVPVSSLPIVLPELDNYKPTEDGRPPLARAEDWVNTIDPETGKPAFRETNTMPQWAGSCWYYLRYIDPRNLEEPISKEKEQHWMPVDLYVGGAEHAVLHLLYSRFWHKVLYDCGVVSTKEPFQKLFNQGMILGTSYQGESGKYYYEAQVEEVDGKWRSKETGEKVTTQIEKMSKSRFNVVNPDDVVAQYGADSVRLYEMFMGPLERDKIWSDEGIQGIYRFLGRVWRFFVDEATGNIKHNQEEGCQEEDLVRLYHQTIRKVGEDIEALKFNTGIASMMECLNRFYKAKSDLSISMAKGFVLLVSPFAPHLAEELWSLYGSTTSLAYAEWPVFDPELAKENLKTVVVQINGKLRSKLEAPLDANQEWVTEQALAQPAVQQLLDGKQIVKEIFVPNKLLNLVIK